MIGIVGYAVPSPSGQVVRALREALQIEQQYAIYNYRLGGWDNQWAQGAFLNGSPQDADRKGRWQWEVQKDQLKLWMEHYKIDVLIFVGGTFGADSAVWAKELGARTALVEVFDNEEEKAQLEHFQGLDFRVGGQHEARAISEWLKAWIAS